MRAKKLFFTWTFLCAATWVFAQDSDLTSLNQTRLKKQQVAMTVLGSWAIGNMATGAAFAGRTSGTTRAFHQMNLGWNAVNLVIAGFGYYGAVTTDPAAMDLATSMAEQQKLEKLLLFNAGLDVGYVMGGLYLMERAKNTADPTRKDRFAGFGRSVVLQGGFLFAFDLITWGVIHHGSDRFDGLINENGIGMVWRF